MTNLWKCPKCGKIVDYLDGEPSKGKTHCEETGEDVHMERVKDE